jgi:predicted esterase
MLRRALHPASLLALFASVALAAPDATTSSAEGVARDLGAAKTDAATAATAFAEAGLDPAAAARLLRELRPAEKGKEGAQRLELQDDHGTSSQLEVIVPRAPRKDGRYGLLVVLHGLRGNAGQLLEFAERIAPEGTIIAAPNAQWLPPEREGEDATLLAQMLLGVQQTGSLDGAPAPEGEDPQAAKRRKQLQRLAEQGHRAAFPHWWSYQPDSFPLRAIDAVRRRWPIDPDRVVLTGYSMGGYGTWNVGLRYEDRFAAIAPFAGGISRLENVQPRDDRSRALLTNATHLPVFVVHGDADPVVPVRFSRTITEELRGLGGDVTYEEVPGGPHVLMPFLRGDERTKHLTAWLADRVRDPHPKKVVHSALGAYHGASYWVKIEELTGESATVTAEVTARDRIVVTTRGVTKLRLFLDPALVDAEAPITVEVDGRIVHVGVVAPSLESVAASFAGRGDATFVQERSVVVELGAVVREF